MCLTEPEWNFPNGKHNELSNFYRLPKIHKSLIKESAINKTAKSLKFFESSDLKLRTIVGRLKCPTGK